MLDEVAKLLSLQRIDNRLELLRKELISRPQLVEAQDVRVSSVASRQKETAEEHLAKKKDIDRADLEVKTLESKIQEVQAKMTQIKTNSEYAAILEQVKRLEGEKETAEERLLELWDEMERLEGTQATLAGDLENARAILAEERKTMETELAEIREEATRLLAERDEARAPIDPELLATYDLLFSRYRDRSVVSSEGKVCTGCHISLNPQTMNQLHADREVVCCKNCSRILYFE